MPGKLRISAPAVVTAGRGFPCDVHISGASPGDTVTIRLWESAGVAPLYSASGTAAINLDGIGVATFDDVVLAGPCHARLVADALLSVTALASDDDHLQVVP
ncbi:MAG TPA: hypothetical protein VHE35_25355 [Kofleriaceae bacterium]|nr:hypothetical protein [Kofleriaceae bacterium]